MADLSKEMLDFSEWKGARPHKAELLVPEASDRRFYLLHYPQTKMVLCHDSRFNTDYTHLSAWFLARNIRVPRIYRQDPHLGLFLADYCGGRDMSSLGEEEYEQALYKAIDIILAMQKTEPDAVISSRSFDREKLRFELDFFVKHWGLFSAAEGIVHHITEEVYQELGNLSDYLADKNKKVVVHRDFHSRNIMITDDNEPCLIDFQDTMMGVRWYDLVSILFDPYRPLDAAKRDAARDYYRSRSGHDSDRFARGYYRTALQRMFKALGSYYMLVAVKKMDKYRESILPALENILYILEQDEFHPCLTDFFTGMYRQVKKS